VFFVCGDLTLLVLYEHISFYKEGSVLGGDGEDVDCNGFLLGEHSAAPNLAQSPQPRLREPIFTEVMPQRGFIRTLCSHSL
jgi:hypothetical protein